MIRTGKKFSKPEMSRIINGDKFLRAESATPEKRLVVTHVAMYYGDKKIIHSSMIVRISSLVPEGDDFYDRQPLAVRRILGHVSASTGLRTVADRPWYY